MKSTELLLALLFDIIIIVILYVIYTKKKDAFEDLNHKLAYLALIITIVVAVPSYISLTSEGSDNLTVTANIDGDALHNYRYEISNLIALYNYDGALDIANQWVKSNPNDGEAWLYKGKVLQELNRNDEAENAFTKAMELGVNIESENPEEKDIPPGIFVSDLAIVNNEIVGRDLIGFVKNSGKNSYENMYVYFNFYDSSGIQVGDTVTAIRNLQPGKTWKIKEPVIDDSATDVELVKIST